MATKMVVAASALWWGTAAFGFAHAADNDPLDFLTEPDGAEPVIEAAQSDPQSDPEPVTEPVSEPGPVTEPAEADEPVTQTQAPSAPRRASLDEIIVKAQKRAENIQDVPLSVTAIGGEDIKQKNLTDLNDIAQFTPNVNILATPTFNFIYIRGVGTGYNRGFEQSVATIIDEVFYGRPSYLSNGLLDLETIEVLRGPQGTLFGKNSAAGALHLRTANPTPEFYSDADFTYGFDNYLRFRGAVSSAIPGTNDELMVRAAVSYEQRDGIVENTFTGKDENDIDRMSGRIKLLWEPSDDWSVLLSVQGGTVDQAGDGSQLTSVRPRHLAAMRVYDPQVSDELDEQNSKDAQGFVDRLYWDATATVKYQIGGGYELASILNYATFTEEVFFDADYSPIPFLTLDNDEDYTQISEELRLTSPPGDFEFVAGLFYFYSKIEADYVVTNFLNTAEILGITGEGEILVCDLLPAALQLGCQNRALNSPGRGTVAATGSQARQNLTGTPALDASDVQFDQTQNSFAVFGQGTWNASERWAVTVGARFTYERKELQSSRSVFNFATGGTGNVGPGNPLGSDSFPLIQMGSDEYNVDLSRTEFDVSPKAVVEYRLNEDIMFYGLAARGFKGGGYNAQAGNAAEIEFDREKSSTFETGIKSEFLGGAARLNVSGFYTKYDDFQTTAFNGTAFIIANADARIYGAEFEATMVPAVGFLLRLSGAFLNARFTDFTDGPCPAELPANQADGSVPGSCDLTGFDMNSAPNFNVTFTAGMAKQLFGLPFRTLTTLTVSYFSETIGATDNDPLDNRDPYVFLRGAVGVQSLDDWWQVMIHMENLTNLQDKLASNDVPTFTGSHFGGVTPAFDAQLQLRIQF